MKRMYSSLIPLLVFGLLAASIGAPIADAQTIKFGNLVDLTGPTSDQG